MATAGRWIRSVVAAGQTVSMRRVLGVGLLAVAVFLMSGPLFGLVTLLAGGELHVAGGVTRVVVDVGLALLLLAGARRLLGDQSLRAA